MYLWSINLVRVEVVALTNAGAIAAAKSFDSEPFEHGQVVVEFGHVVYNTVVNFAVAVVLVAAAVQKLLIHGPLDWIIVHKEASDPERHLDLQERFAVKVAVDVVHTVDRPLE